MKAILIAASFLGSMAACVSTPLPMDDLTLEQKLQHTWSYRETATSGAVVEGETTYLPGGVMNLFGHVYQAGKTQTIVGSGTWYVKNGYLYYTVKNSNISNMIPNGFTSADKIVRVTDREAAYLSSSSGQIETERRIR